MRKIFSNFVFLRKSELYQGDALVRQSIIILALLNESIPLVTVRSNVSLLTEQLFAHSTLVHFVSKNKVLSLFLLWSKEFEGVLVFDTKLNQFQFSFVFIKFHSILETTTLHIYLSIVRQAAHYSQISSHHYLIILSYFEMDFNR